MSTEHARADKSPRRERFEPTAEPRPLTSADLEACRHPSGEPTDCAADKQAVFAVAVRDGVLHSSTPGRDLDQPHLSVLYVTADGEQAFGKRVAAGGGLSLVERALAVDRRELQPATDAAQRFAPVARRHPEV